MTTDFSTRLNFSPCLHRHILAVTTGGMQFTDGEVCDDIQEFLLCTDCMEYLTEAEIRARWNGDSSQEACDVDF